MLSARPQLPQKVKETKVKVKTLLKPFTKESEKWSENEERGRNGRKEGRENDKL